MGTINLVNDINKIDIKKNDHMLGKTLLQPFSGSNSGSRKLMFGTQHEQAAAIINPEVPYLSTGYENEFGTHSSSYVEIGHDMEVVGCVSKYLNRPKHHMFIFTADHENMVLEVFERKEYKHVTENYGYLYDNDYLDSISYGDIIKAGTAIQKSKSFDEYNNRMDGVNLLTLYSACEETMEDAIVISESASKKLAFPLIKRVEIKINDNDIPLNLYGDMEHYKAFPDIGEEIKNSTLLAFRREKKEEMLFSQSYARLREKSLSDESYTTTGRVVDIDIYCNTPEKLAEYSYNAQFKFYYENHLRVCGEIVQLVETYLAQGYKLTYDLQKLYSDSKGALNGKQYFGEKVFSNIQMYITVIEENDALIGDKLSNRYGGKGIISRVKPDHLMPRTLDGKTVDIILNMCGVYGRENAGQLFETSLSYISMRLLQFMNMQVMSVDECIEQYLKLIKIISPSMAECVEQHLDRMSEDDMIAYIGSLCCSEKSIYLVVEPMSENMTIDKLKEIYEEFPWIKPEPMMMPIIDSAREVKYVPSRRPLIYGYQYIYRLKQYAEEKFSVTSLSATNIRNENSKSKSSNNYKALYSRTPIRFGDMETGNLIHLGAELVVQMLMLYSTSPHARRLTEQMLTGDAFNIDVKLDMESRNRNVEILNVYLKTLGLRLTFSRHPKKLYPAFLVEPMYFFDDPKRLVEGLIPLNKEEKFDMEKEVLRLIKEKDYVHGLEIYPMEFTRLDKNEGGDLNGNENA